MVCRPIGGCLIVALRHDRGGTPIGAADPCRTSCPGCRGSYREGFSHWCRSRSFDGPRPNGSQTELLHSAWAPVSAPGSALGLLLSRALSSAQAAPHWTGRAFHTIFCTTRPSIPRRSRAFLNRRDVSERVPHAARPINSVPFPLISMRGNGNAPPKRSAQTLPARGRAAQPARVLQRLKHLAKALVLDRKAVA